MKHSVFIFRTGQLGDTLVSLPAMRAVRRHHPESRLVLITEKAGRGLSPWDVLDQTGLFDDVFLYDPAAGWLGQMTRLCQFIRAASPEALYYFSQDRRAAWRLVRDHFFFKFLAGVPRVAGFRVTARPRVCTGRLPKQIAEWQRLLEQNGFPVTEVKEEDFRFPVSDAACRLASQKISAAGLDGQILVAIGAGSKMAAKRWPIERFVECGRRLLDERPDLRLVTLGGKEDRAVGELLVSAWGTRAVNFCGLPLSESAAVLERCRLYVGNDTGVMHLAAAMGVRCVAIFSARDYPGVWEPFGQHAILRRDVPCAGCMLEICEKQKLRCLNEISSEEVTVQAKRLLGAKG